VNVGSVALFGHEGKAKTLERRLRAIFALRNYVEKGRLQVFLPRCVVDLQTSRFENYKIGSVSPEGKCFPQMRKRNLVPARLLIDHIC